jgi:large subunit ribosomal protein L21
MNTYAVIETGGKQYKVEKGTSLLVDRLSAKQGDKVALRPVLFRDKEVVAGAKELEKVKVEATVTEHLRGKKIKVFKYKPKKGYRRRAGHRSELTKLEVTEVRMGAAAKKPVAAKEEKPAAAKPAAAKKPAAKKEPAKEKPVAEKKPAAKKAPAKKPAAKKAKAPAKKAAAKKPAAKAKAKPKSPTKPKPAAKKDSDDGA